MAKKEVYPFWNVEDMKGMMDCFLMKEQWNHYLTFMLGLLLGRRIGDTLSFKWKDIFNKNGTIKDEIKSFEEQKTGKNTDLCISPAAEKAVNFYIQKTGINPMDNYYKDIFPTERKDVLYSNKDDYTPEEYEEQYWEAIKNQSATYRKAFVVAAELCDIKYPVSTHSTRKTFGYWSKMIHPYDIESLDILQDIFAHSSQKTTRKYIGLTKGKKNKYFYDFGDFIESVSAGEKYIVKNSPVITLKSDDLRVLFEMAYSGGFDKEDKYDLLNRIYSLAEESMVI